MAASSESAKLLELLQLQNAEGTCLESFHAGEPIAENDLRGRTTAGRSSRAVPWTPGCSPCMPSRCACATR